MCGWSECGQVCKEAIIVKEGAMAKRVVIDEDECVGCESCTDLCPDIFEFDEGTEKAKVIKQPEGGDIECVEEAIETCPTECIYWEDDE